jgi:hypothetical protein
MVILGGEADEAVVMDEDDELLLDEEMLMQELGYEGDHEQEIQKLLPSGGKLTGVHFEFFI